MGDPRNVIIIGSGPAGYTAAIYAARANLAPLVFEGSVTAGGALMNTTDVENFPGFPDGVMGPDLMDHLRKQAERFGAELVTDDVTAVDLTGEIKVVTDGSGAEHRAQAVIIATGSGYRELGLPNEKRLSGRGVSWCATCDGFFFRDQDIAVVGGGDTAMEEATFLTRFARSVTVVHRRDSLRASKIMQERAFANEKIRFLWNSEVVDVVGETKVAGRHVRNVVTGEESTLDVTGLFVAIGHDPRSELFGGQVRRDDEGYILVDSPSTRTNLAGVFACGDVVDHIYRQAVTAAGTGCCRRSRRRALSRPRSRTPDHRRPGSGRRRQRRSDRTTDAGSAPDQPGQTPSEERTTRGNTVGATKPSPTPPSAPTCWRATSRPGRLLGRVVRTVPPGLPDPRGDRRRARGQDRRREAQRRREPAHRRRVRRHLDPDAERLPGRRGREDDRRRQAQGDAARGPRSLHLTPGTLRRPAADQALPPDGRIAPATMSDRTGATGPDAPLRERAATAAATPARQSPRSGPS